MIIKQIIKKFLEENGYTGLYCEECGCELSDLMPCDEPSPDCTAGYKLPGDLDSDWRIGELKPKEQMFMCSCCHTWKYISEIKLVEDMQVCENCRR